VGGGRRGTVAAASGRAPVEEAGRARYSPL